MLPLLLCVSNIVYLDENQVSIVKCFSMDLIKFELGKKEVAFLWFFMTSGVEIS